MIESNCLRRLGSSFILGLLFLSSVVEARFATPSDAASEIQIYNRTLEVNEDGTSDELYEVKVKILNETGRSNYASQSFYYDEATQKLKILAAKTIDQNQEYPVSSDAIEDKPVASQSSGFSSYRQVLVSFPRVHIGSEVYLKYRIQQTSPYLKGTFFTDFIYGRDGLWTSSKVRLVSALPFTFVSNDPDGVLDIQPKQEGKKQVLEIALKQPVIKQVVDEQDVMLSHKALPWVSVASVSDWKTLIEKIAPEYERVLTQPMPSLFQGIADQVANEPDFFKKINQVTSRLAQEVHYMGDWRSVSGRIYPQALEKIAQTRSGDCKDFATVTAAILRKLGIQAHPAWVRRGGFYEDPNGLPSVFAYNHAIVRVEKDGRVFWIDPTNFVSFAHGLFPDISDRSALPLIVGAKGKEQIPAIQPEGNQIQASEELQFLDKDRSRVQGDFSLSGAFAIGITGASLRASKENIDYMLINFVGDANRMSRWKLSPYDLTSRVVQDVGFEYEYEKRNSELRTSDGPAHLLQASTTVARYLARIQDRVSDLLVIDQPATFKKTTLLKNVKVVGKTQLNCKVESRWLSAHRRVVQKKTGIEVDDRFAIRTILIPNAELKTAEFLRFQEKLDDCFNNVAVVFKP